LVQSPFKERNEEILRLIESGLSHRLTAAALNISKSTVNGVNARKDPKSYKKKCRIRRARIVETRARNCIKERIKRVDKILAAQNLPERTVEWLNHYKTGMNIVAIATLYPITHQAIAKEFKKIGLDVKGLSIQYKKWGSKSSF
jgi:hypothetical protein